MAHLSSLASVTRVAKTTPVHGLLAAAFPSTDEDESGGLINGNGPFGLQRPVTPRYCASETHFS